MGIKNKKSSRRVTVVEFSRGLACRFRVIRHSRWCPTMIFVKRIRVQGERDAHTRCLNSVKKSQHNICLNSLSTLNSNKNLYPLATRRFLSSILKWGHSTEALDKQEERMLSGEKFDALGRMTTSSEFLLLSLIFSTSIDTVDLITSLVQMLLNVSYDLISLSSFSLPIDRYQIDTSQVLRRHWRLCGRAR